MNFRALVRFLALIFGTLHLGALTSNFPDSRDPLSGMGVNIHFTDAQPGELEMLARAGFRWVRMDLHWESTEKAPGVYDFSAYDRLLNRLDAFHIHALLIFDYTNPFYDNGAPTHSDEGGAAFARWAVAAATHFKDRGVLWEIWNEPNGYWFWRPKANADDYAKLALTVSEAMHRAVPNEKIVGPALRGTHLEFLDVVAQAGVLAYWSGRKVTERLTSKPVTWPKNMRCPASGLTSCAGNRATARSGPVSMKISRRNIWPGSFCSMSCPMSL